LERWDCLGKQLFSGVPKGEKADEHFYVEHDCGGVGWGNSVRGLYNSASLAALMGRRLIVTHEPFNRMFLPPYSDINRSDVENPDHWDYGLSLNPEFNRWDTRETWDYEAYGRDAGNFRMWANTIRMNPLTVGLEKPVMVAGVCGGDRSIMLQGDCLENVLTKFVGCAGAEYDPKKYMPDNILSVPYFYMMFKKPAPRMVELLKTVRERLGLPILTPDQEAVPGQRGLNTPGYYIFALHLRHIPVGFEPLAIDLNKDSTLENRLSLLDGYWQVAEKNAKKAKEIAECRGEKLLIYFATDDVSNMREVAKEKLGKYGKVVWGLDKDEVGHMSPQWTPSDEKVLSRVKETGSLHGEKSYGDDSHHEEMDSKAKILLTNTAHLSAAERKKSNGETWNLSETLRHQEATRIHADMAMVEWFILAHAQWLQGHSGSSFAESAGGLGLSPLGAMERMDIVHSSQHSAITFRRDYSANADFCTPVGAADPAQAAKCPNKDPKDAGADEDAPGPQDGSEM